MRLCASSAFFNMAHEKTILKAFEQAADNSKQRAREESIVMGGMTAMLDVLGGPEKALGDLLIKGHEDAMGDNKRLRLDWTKIFLQAGDMYDTRNASAFDLSEVDLEDVRAGVTEYAIKMLKEDAEFRQACLIETFKQNPDFLEELESEQALLL